MIFFIKVNLSPALSNDCEVDSEVKKPLLHDLFDLLGLPVCNTGLSLFTVWTSQEIEEDNEVKCYNANNKCTKKRCKTLREPMKIVNVYPDARSMVIKV